MFHTALLLHAAQAAAHALVFDPRIAASAAVALAAILLLIWKREVAAAGGWAARRPGRRRLALVAVSVLAAAAVLPSVVPYDHLGSRASAQADDHADVHALHCHSTPASCADAPVTSGPGQLMTSEPLLVVPALLATVLLVVVAAPRSVAYRPRLRPPMAAA